MKNLHMGCPHPKQPTLGVSNPNASELSSMKKALFAVFLMGIGIVAGQTPPDQARQIELEKEAMRRAEAQRIHEAIDRERERLRFIGFPTLTPAQPIIIMQPPLKKVENK